jgi:hypothetical protein
LIVENLHRVGCIPRRECIKFYRVTAFP